MVALALLVVTPAPDLRTSITALIAKERDFNGTVLVARDGKRLYRRNFGVADRAFGTKVKDSTRFRISSMTKAFTSAIVLRLVDEGKLDLDRPIATYFPSFPGEGGDRILLRQLLNHTSGLPNPDANIKGYPEARKEGLDQYQRAYTVDELVARHARGPLRTEPGKAFEYSNTDYIVLGRIVEAVLNQPFETALRERFLAPLGMRNTGMFADRRIIPNLASNYMQPDPKGELQLEMPLNIENWYAAGAMYSTADDLLRFFEPLFQGRLLKPESLEAMLKPGLDDYGFGMWVFTANFNGKRRTAVQRPGLIMGANVGMLHLREDRTTIIVLSNTNGPDVGKLSHEIAQIVE